MEINVTNYNVPAIVGEAVAGESAQVRKELEQIISKVNTSALDIGELLHKIKKNGYYEGYNTFADYQKTLEIKSRKAQYLRRIAEVMDTLEIPRSVYEPLGVSKLREITSLNVSDTWVNPETKEETPMKAFIQGFVDKGQSMGIEEVKQHVKTLKGLTGENSLGWVHFYMKQAAIDQVVRPALDKAKMLIGSVSKDDEGNSQDASDGRAAEVVFVAFLTDEKGPNETLDS